ncbi:hypothetical protein KY313_03005 [Candidatus Woesearchaeota archaeon]|jgi:hypothetical protein|nr:hypothetical protein [Candidatus Woesearchaeota archaeon]
MNIKDLKSLLYEDIIRRNKLTPFIIFVFFLISFGLSRAVVILFPETSLYIRQYHIHHFYYGIILLFASNWISLVSDRPNLHNIAAGLTGFGLGLVVDEIGLLLTCSSPGFVCNYWHRLTYDVVIWLVGLFFVAIYFEPFWRFIKKEVTWLLPKRSKK